MTVTTNRARPEWLPYVLFSLTLAVAAVLSSPLPALSEGSRSLYPATYDASGFRASMDQRDTLLYVGQVRNVTFLYVYAQAGEYILVGSSNRNNGGDINIYNPQSFGAKGNETIPVAADFVCNNTTPPAPHFGGTGRGIIASRTQELAGPNSADNSVLVTNGWSPCAYQAPSTGIYGVLFEGATSGGSGTPNGSIGTFQVGSSTVWAWDVTVRADAISTTDLNGRLFTYAWVGFTGNNPRGLFSTHYYVTSDGYRYAQVLRGFDPNAYTLYSNAQGFLDAGQPLYRDLRSDATGDNSVDTFHGDDTIVAQAPDYPLFFSAVDPAGPNATQVDLVLGTLGIPLTPKPPQVNSFSFSYPPAGGATTYLGQGGVFAFSTTDTVSFQIVISQDGVDFDPATATNRVLTGLASTGDHTISWDGKDNAGNDFPPGGPYPFRVTGRSGEVHFPFVDAENNPSGGPTVTKLNGNVIDSIVYFDDRGYRTSGGVDVGTPNGNICPGGNPVPPAPIFSLVGVDSSDANFNGVGLYYRTWVGSTLGPANNDCELNGGFGNMKALDLWTYQSTAPQANALTVIDAADVTATVSAPGGATPGSAVNVAVAFGNVGSQTAANTGYSITLPPGLSGVSCSGATCSYDSGTGLVTITGLPGSLSPGQFENMVLTYTAPASGSTPITADVTTTSSQGPNIAPDTDSGTTIVDPPSNADVLTTVAAPPTAVAGGTVNVGVTFANVGALAASGVVYTLTLGTGLTGVSCSGSGVTCTYAAGTGVATLSGLPTTLVSGQTIPFTVSYTAPASGVVPVDSTIATASAEANTANNTAHGATTVEGDVNADVVAQVSAPSTAAPGSTVSVLVDFGNVGAAPAAGVTYDLTLPAGLTGVSCTGATCNYNSGTGLVTVTGLPTSLSSGQFTSLTLNYTAPLSGVVPVSAHVATSSAETNTGNNTASGATTIVASSTAVDVAAVVNPPVSAVAGQPVNVPVTFTNLGPAAATGVTYSMTLPAGLSGVSCVGATCNYNSGTGEITVTGLPGSLANGETTALTLIYTAPATGPVPVSATVGTASVDSNPGNNVASGSTAITDAAVADVTTTVAPPAAAVAGSTVNVPVTYSNLGPANATGMTYTLNLPPGLTGVSCSGGGVSCTYDLGTGVVTLLGMPGSLANGAGVAFTLSYTAPATGPVTVNSTIDTTTTESNEANNQAASATDIAGADVTTTVTAPPDGVVGTPVDVTVEFANNGPSTATGMTYSVTLTPGLTAVSCSGGGVTCTYDSGTGTLTLLGLPGTLTNGQVVSFTVTYTSPVPGPVTVTSTIATATNQGANSGPDNAGDSTTLVAPADLTIAKSHSGNFAQGQVGATYSVIVTNLGSSATVGTVTVTETPPAALTVVQMTGTGWDCTTLPACTRSDALAPSQSYPPITVTVNVSPSAPPNVINVATISGGGDVGSTNNSASDPTSIDAPDLAIAKLHTGSFRQGQPDATYTIVVTNVGSAPTSGTVTVVETLPAGLSATDIAGDGWSCDLGTLTCMRADALAPSQSYPPITLTVSIAQDAPANVVNLATVSGGGDANAANNTADDPTVIDPPAPIPTLGEWAFLLLAALLAAHALRALRRRRRSTMS